MGKRMKALLRALQRSNSSATERKLRAKYFAASAINIFIGTKKNVCKILFAAQIDEQLINTSQSLTRSAQLYNYIIITAGHGEGPICRKLS